MHESNAKRFASAAFFAMLAGVTVAFWNPMDSVKADLRSDSRGVTFGLHLAADAVRDCARLV